MSGRQRRLDRALEVEVEGKRRWLHVEWQLVMDGEVAFRVYEYHVLFALALADEARLGGASRVSPSPPSIDSVVVLLSGREEPWPAEGEYCTSVSEQPFSGVRFRIEPVYQRTVSELMARDNPLWLIFAPLAADADAPGLTKVVEALRARASPRQFEELGVAMGVLADADKRRRGLMSVVTSLLPEELVMQSWIYKQGEQKGLEQGLEPLAHLFERRLGRSLSSSERTALVQHLGSLGPVRLGDLVLDLTPDTLTAWLVASDAS